MKRIVYILLIVALLLSGTAEAATIAGPTPKPGPVVAGGMPPYLERGRGLPAQAWMDTFLDYARMYEIPVSASAFDQLSHYQEDGYTTGMYRLEAGGAEVFLQVIDEETVIQVIVYLDGERMETPEMAEAMAAYLPLVLRSCVATCEEDLPEAEITRLLTALHLDIAAMARGWEVTDITIRPYRTLYRLTCRPATESITFMCYWNL